MTIRFQANRLAENPIIVPDMDGRMGANINGPSLIRTPEWLPNALGKYYLYFGHHRGDYIRLAFADALTGPWRTYEQGVLDLNDSFFEHHIASPDVLIDEEARRLVMYFHGRRLADGPDQGTRVSVSDDGLTFRARPEVLGRPYFRVFQHDGSHYAIGMPGYVYRSDNALKGFEEGPQILPDNTRHVATLIRDDTLHLFHTYAYQTRESIMVGDINLRSDWQDWTVTDIREVLRPETEWEGANLPPMPSERGPIDIPVNQLRDPAIFQEDGTTWLLYSVAGEGGLAIASLTTS